MQLVRDHFKATQTLHHAYILEGDQEASHKEVCLFCEEDLSFRTRGNVDFVYEAYDTFKIEHARQLHDLQLNKTRAGSRKIFVVSFNFITNQAQNALLKVLEEPTQGTHFFILTPSAHVFLPTVLSRVTLIKMKGAGAHADVATFLESSYGDRMKYVAKLVKQIRDEKASKADALALLRGLVVALHAQAKTKDDFVVLQELQSLTSYLEDSSASTKMLLEHAALVI